MDFNMVGPAISLGLACIGSSIGCWISGSAAHAAMSRLDEGHGKFLVMAAAPSSQAIYGFALMFLMKQAVVAGTLSPISAIAIGIFSGMAFLLSAVFQGRVCATGIQASMKKPAIFGKCFVAVGIIESFALSAMAFAFMLLK